jgi:hypothetical protein
VAELSPRVQEKGLHRQALSAVVASSDWLITACDAHDVRVWRRCGVRCVLLGGSCD